MANQYSITVSDESNAVLKLMKDGGYKVSQAIDEAIKTLGSQGLARLITYRRQIKALEGDEE
tara:strand:+ start:2093 stop:2278 length:186 start_codon:yes stop_codon:yes gene_type:complete